MRKGYENQFRILFSFKNRKNQDWYKKYENQQKEEKKEHIKKYIYEEN